MGRFRVRRNGSSRVRLTKWLALGASAATAALVAAGVTAGATAGMTATVSATGVWPFVHPQPTHVAARPHGM